MPTTTMAKVSHAKISPRTRLGKTLRPRPKTLPNISVKQIQIHTNKVKPQSRKMIPRLLQLLEHKSFCQCRTSVCSNLLVSYNEALHYVHFVKYDDTVSFYDAVSDTIRRRGGDRGIFTEEGVDTVAYFGGNHGFRV